ncbi:hypothetical protein JVT61DRAFT_11211 [Boletus reticuloceps]|uniref:Uncharacterized protein n=1 Tax=Boletus reticuloceps TaxID=495285 RepID=A0A8I2YEW1_9AGAM|nr:hypothetical protein JVT61DRAFT_11211 [Boletus reticuloceps]
MSPSNQPLTFRTYHIVLLLEAIVMTTWVNIELILFPTVFLLAQQIPFPQHLASHFGLLTGIIALMLSGGLYATVQRKPRWIQVCWHILYHVSYSASFFYAWRITLQAVFPDWFADSGLPHDFFGRGIFLAIAMLILVVVDIPYVTMIAVATGKHDRAGPIFKIYKLMRCRRGYDVLR